MAQRKVDKKKHDIKMARVKKEAAVARKKIAARKASRTIAEKFIDSPITKKVAKKAPYIGGAIIVHDVIKGIGKSTCVKRGGKWVGGKCQGAKKSTRKITSPQVRDPISKR